MGLRRRIRVGMELTRRGCRVAVLGDGRRKVAAALEASWETQDPPGPEAPPALTDFVRRHRLHQRRAVVGVPADRVTVRLLHLPPMPERQLRRAVA
ncbi:hypothetical protein, partial [Alicyclobacillus sp.]|uniref:hypothetical protein n=1 Tax=Alicyclobacillus sp. TaxID=61169 RepID=UPI0025C0F1F2